ncbi:MAG: hypothetical protein L0228_06970 [Planctomycetes bacterium]|nr:hypothetical protein [Planctomycetota bacterium]
MTKNLYSVSAARRINDGIQALRRATRGRHDLDMLFAPCRDRSASDGEVPLLLQLYARSDSEASARPTQRPLTQTPTLKRLARTLLAIPQT